jgi:hypothetical protein
MYDGRTVLLSEEKMRLLGFTDHVPESWYFVAPLTSDGKTTLNIRIQKDSGLYEELVMNEDFGQPEYYGHKNKKLAELIKDTIDLIVDHLNKSGLTIFVDHRQYGVENDS